MNWKKWIKKHWWKALIPVTVPVGIIILRHIDKISEVKEIIEYENVKKTLQDVQLLTDEKGHYKTFSCLLMKKEKLFL